MSELELEVGEFVRLANGEIDKIKNIIHDILHQDRYITIEFEKNVPIMQSIYIKHIFPPNIVKHSKDIIDLIEVGDYVNGEKIIDLSKEFVLYKEGELGIIDTDTDFAFGIVLKDMNIKSIVTKEMFKSVEYEVE